SALERAPEVSEGILAGIEWLYLPLFGPGRREPKSLFKALATSPELFSEVVRMVFRSEQEPESGAAEPKATARERERARRGWQVLHDWSHVPGLKDDGRMDEVELHR